MNSFKLEDGRDTSAPSLAKFETLADTVDRRLPARFRALCSGLVIRVTDFPTEDVLREMDLDDEFGILGLFSGIGLPDARAHRPTHIVQIAPRPGTPSSR